MNNNLTPRINGLENNLIIDGDHKFWPEGTSRTIANNSGAYGSVLFLVSNTDSGITITNSRQSSPGNGLLYSNQISKTASGTLSAGTLVRHRYVVEGYDIQPMINKEHTLIFFVKSSIATARTVTFNNGDFSHSLLKTYNINAANTWQLVTIKIPALSTCPGILDQTNGRGLNIGFTVVAGSTFQTSTTNSWTSGNFHAQSGQDSTWLTGTTHDFSIKGVMLLAGDWEGLSESQYNYIRAGKNIQQEYAMTQRYYEKSYDLDVVPGANTNVGVHYNTGVPSTQSLRITGKYSVPKRTTPTLIFYNPVTGATGQARAENGTNGAVSINNNGLNSWTLTDGNALISQIWSVHYTSDSRF